MELRALVGRRHGKRHKARTTICAQVHGVYFWETLHVVFEIGEVYFGRYFNSDAIAYPDGGIPEYIAGVEIGQEISRFRPYIIIETIIDEKDGASFHPASIRYDLGIGVDIWKGISAKLEHSCWHPVDRGGTVEEYNLFTIRYRFKQ